MKRTQRPEVDEIKGISPTILIDQARLGASTRSTVGTATEIYTYLRLLFSRAGSKQLDAGYFSFNNPKGACKVCRGLGIEVDVDIHVLVDFEKSGRIKTIKLTANGDRIADHIEKIKNLLF